MGEKSGPSSEEKGKGKEKESVLEEDVFAGQSYLQSELLPSIWFRDARFSSSSKITNN